MPIIGDVLSAFDEEDSVKKKKSYNRNREYPETVDPRF